LGKTLLRFSKDSCDDDAPFLDWFDIM
jgi:hypothetical protein